MFFRDKVYIEDKNHPICDIFYGKKYGHLNFLEFIWSLYAKNIHFLVVTPQEMLTQLPSG